MTVTNEEKLEGGTRVAKVTTPPEGGWGWMIVAGCFLSTVCTRAVTRCVSIFFVEFQLHFEKDYSTTAWTQSLIDSITMLCAPLGGFLMNRLSCRATVMLGGLLSSAGLVLSSFTSSLEYLYMFLGILTGFGFALSYTPAIAMVGRYFSERKALAYGIAMSGSGIGTFILAPTVQFLIERYSWRGALLILGGFISNLCVCGALMRPLEPGSSDRMWENNVANLEKDCTTPALESGNTKLINSMSTEGIVITNGALKNSRLADTKPTEPLGRTRTRSRAQYFHLESRKEFGFLLMPDFLILSVSFLFLAYGCSAPVVYLVPYALSVGLEHRQAAFLMSIFGVSGIVGNVTFGWITDRKCLRRYRMLSYVLAIGMNGLCCMFVHLLRSFIPLLTLSLLYGYFEGAYVALIPVVTSDVVGSTYLTSALGVVYFLHAIPYLISPPIGGWFIDRTGNYAATFLFSGASFMCSSAVLAAAMLARRCQKSKSDSASHTTAAAQ